MDVEALKARRLLDEGVAQAEVARRLKTTRQSVSRWARQPRKVLAQVPRQGRTLVFLDECGLKMTFSDLTDEAIVT